MDALEALTWRPPNLKELKAPPDWLQDLDPDAFRLWLIREGQADQDMDYPQAVAGGCEYAGLWLGMAFEEQVEESWLVLGRIGLWEHYWVQWREWWIDLTLCQFMAAPALCCWPVGVQGYRKVGEEPLKDYLVRVQAKEFYAHPWSRITPPKGEQLQTWGELHALGGGIDRIMDGLDDWLDKDTRL